MYLGFFQKRNGNRSTKPPFARLPSNSWCFVLLNGLQDMMKEACWSPHEFPSLWLR